MMVTFVSQCEKKALNRTRRVLDAFADRIGDNTWQTVITQAGLLAVKTLRLVVIGYAADLEVTLFGLLATHANSTTKALCQLTQQKEMC